MNCVFLIDQSTEQIAPLGIEINNRMFSSFSVDQTLWYLFYNSVIRTLFLFVLLPHKNMLCKSSAKTNRVIKRASKIPGHELSHMDWLLRSLSLKKISTIENTNHPLAVFVKRSVRSNKPLLLITKRHKWSFLRFAISLLEFYR